MKRWKCRGCGSYMPDNWTVRARHMIHVSKGSGIRGVIGMKRVMQSCGPIVEVDVGAQEQFIEWLEATP